MKVQTIFVILNPKAAGGRCKRHAKEAIKKLKSSGKLIVYYETERENHGREIAKNAYLEGYRHFLSIGGDGTHHEVINGLFPISLAIGEKPILQILSVGSGNSFVRDFIKDPKKYDPALSTIAQDKLCDVIRLTHQTGELYFMNLLGIGFVAEVALMRNHYFNRFGKLGYVFSVLIKTLRLRSAQYRLLLDNKNELVETATFFSFNNSRYTGGAMMIAPYANTNDGLVEIIQATQISRFMLIKLFPKIFTGEHIHSSYIKRYNAKKINFNFENNIPVMIDGELITIKPTQLEVLPQVLKIRI